MSDALTEELAFSRAEAADWQKRAVTERARAEAAEGRVGELEAALQEAIEFADEGWAYASPYFIEKWDYKGHRERLQAALKGKGLDDG
jgi:hypothetical protein